MQNCILLHYNAKITATGKLRTLKLMPYSYVLMCAYICRECVNCYKNTTNKWAFGNSENGKLKRKTEMIKMKIIYCLIHTSLERPPVKQDH